jgi:hypothetical protein
MKRLIALAASLAVLSLALPGAVAADKAKPAPAHGAQQRHVAKPLHQPRTVHRTHEARKSAARPARTGDVSAPAPQK